MHAITSDVGPRSDDSTPLAARMRALTGFRFALVAVLVGIGAWRAPLTREILVVAAGYLAVSALLALLPHLRWRLLKVSGFAAAFVADAAYLEYVHVRMGRTIPIELAIAAFLVAVCLLASAPIGLLAAAVQSGVLVAGARAQQAGMVVVPGGEPVPAIADLVPELVLLWLTVMTTAIAAWVQQRELRRRRRDAEAVREYSASLHNDTSVEDVAERLLRFAAGHLHAPRAAVVRQHRDCLELVAGRGVAAAPHVAAGTSSMLGLASLSRQPTLAMSLDPLLDSWLAQIVPGARRLVIVRLDIGLDARMWLLAEHRNSRGRRLERRFVAALTQVAAATALALARVQLLAAAHQAATLDGLTGVANRRSLDQLLERLTDRHARSGAGFSLIMVDVDRFKSINDRLGHQAGDEVLQQVASTMQAQLRMHETIARYGGEEFTVVLPDADAAEATAVAERLRLSLHTISDPVPVTASFGIAAVPADAADGAGATALADAALLRAKQNGRDRVEVAFAKPVEPAEPIEPVERSWSSGTGGSDASAVPAAPARRVPPPLGAPIVPPSQGTGSDILPRRRTGASGWRPRADTGQGAGTVPDDAEPAPAPARRGRHA